MIIFLPQSKGGTELNKVKNLVILRVLCVLVVIIFAKIKDEECSIVQVCPSTTAQDKLATGVQLKYKSWSPKISSAL
jgi:hypothetical protein